jgi:hypothetical protein
MQSRSCSMSKSRSTLSNLDTVQNALWNAIRERITHALQDRPACGDVQRQTDRLMRVVLDAVSSLTPEAKPTPYAKRWWIRDLTKLRQVYTCRRNRAAAQRRGGEALSVLEQQARAAAKGYYDAIYKQQRLHWDEFLAEDTNIWKAYTSLFAGRLALTIASTGVLCDTSECCSERRTSSIASNSVSNSVSNDRDEH